MKKSLLILILLISLTALFACGDNICKNHTDTDKNAVCDTCGKAVPCAECTDENLDALCDVCKGAVARTSRTEEELYFVAVENGYNRSIDDFRAELSGMLSLDAFWHIGDTVPDRLFGKGGDRYLLTETLTVYARDYNEWSEVYTFSLTNEVTVSFKTNTDEVIEPITVNRGETVTLTAPSRLGFEFLGWYYTDGVNETLFTEDTAVTRNVSLVAKWRGAFVTYEDFGAVGNGVTDDFSALYRAHVYANGNSLTVKASDSATYYISDTRIDGKVTSIPIKTNTVWGNAKFIIDDTYLNYLTDPDAARCDIFTVYPSREAEKIVNSETLKALGSTSTGTDRLPLSLDRDAIIVIEDNSHTVYRRYGSSLSASERSGIKQSDALLINSIGTVSNLSPITYDYQKCSSATLYTVDKAPLTISGGEFITYASALDASTEDGSFGSYRRGIHVMRSNVTLEGIKHYVTGEISIEDQNAGIEGAAYRGFIYIQYAAGVTLKDSVITARRYYGSESYDLCAHTVIGLTLDGVTQSNFFINEDGTASETETEYSSLLCYSGVTATNFSKSITVRDSSISSFDAHYGLYGGSIEGSKLNLIMLTGKGGFKISNTEFYSAGTQESYNSLINLKSDYGSSWDGKIEILNVTAHVKDADFHLLYHTYSNWDFGYSTHIPELEISDLKIITPSGEADTGYEVKLITTHRSLVLEPSIHLGETESTHPIRDAESFAEDASSYENLNPVTPPELIKIKSNSHGYIYTVPKSSLFDNTRFTSGELTRTGTGAERHGDFLFKELSDY